MAEAIQLKNDPEPPTPEDWRAMSLKQRYAWKRYWRGEGAALKHNCLKCGYPTQKTVNGCQSCRR